MPIDFDDPTVLVTKQNQNYVIITKLKKFKDINVKHVSNLILQLSFLSYGWVGWVLDSERT